MFCLIRTQDLPTVVTRQDESQGEKQTCVLLPPQSGRADLNLERALCDFRASRSAKLAGVTCKPLLNASSFSSLDIADSAH